MALGLFTVYPVGGAGEPSIWDKPWPAPSALRHNVSSLLVDTCLLCDISQAFVKFYSQFSNVMAVLRKSLSELATLHLVKIHCLPTLLFGCENWNLSDQNTRSLNVAWNNCFRHIFKDSGGKVSNYYSFLWIYTIALFVGSTQNSVLQEVSRVASKYHGLWSTNGQL